jgi:transcriptional regulator with XRE-family HTH domain
MTMAMPGVRRPFIPTEGERRIAESLRETRERKRLTQGEVAKKIGVTSQTLLRYEKLKRAIPVGHLLGLQEVLGPLGPGQSVFGAGAFLAAESQALYGGGEQDPDAVPAGPDEAMLLRLFRSLPSKERNAVVGYAAKLADHPPRRAK